MGKFEDLKQGQHAWVLCSGLLLMVAKFGDTFEVCGAWDGGINPNECEIISLVDVPKGFEDVELYYK